MGLTSSRNSFCTDDNKKLFQTAINREGTTYYSSIDNEFIKKYSSECPIPATEVRRKNIPPSPPPFSSSRTRVLTRGEARRTGAVLTPPLQVHRRPNRVYNNPVYNTLKNKKYKGIVVYGLGCHADSENLQFISNYLSSHTRIPIDVMCDQSELLSVGSTIAATYCKITPWKWDKFVQSVYNNVKRSISEGFNVILIGHSYGGSVAARVAEIFNNSPEPEPNVEIVTMGSIYIPKEDSVKNVKIKNFMYTYDVALKCNGLKENDNRVTWLDSKLPKPKFSFLGTVEQWKVHVNYEDLIIKILKNQNINGGARKSIYHKKKKNQ